MYFSTSRGSDVEISTKRHLCSQILTLILTGVDTNNNLGSRCTIRHFPSREHEILAVFRCKQMSGSDLAYMAQSSSEYDIYFSLFADPTLDSVPASWPRDISQCKDRTWRGGPTTLKICQRLMQATLSDTRCATGGAEEGAAF